nr:hypothetical protein [Candidatus Chlorobium masyuteum]
MRTVRRVRPHAIRADAERTVAIISCYIRLLNKSRCAVGIRRTQRTGRSQNSICLRQARRARAAYHRRIIGARHCHGYDLRRSISGRYRNTVGIALTCSKLVMRTVRRVRPHAIRADAERTVAIRAGCIRLLYKSCRAICVCRT